MNSLTLPLAVLRPRKPVFLNYSRRDHPLYFAPRRPCRCCSRRHHHHPLALLDQYDDCGHHPSKFVLSRWLQAKNPFLGHYDENFSLKQKVLLQEHFFSLIVVSMKMRFFEVVVIAPKSQHYLAKNMP